MDVLGMKNVDFNETYKQIYTDIWQIHKRYVNIDSPDSWEYLMHDIDVFTQKYNNDFSLKLAQAVLSEIEASYRERKC